MNDIRFREYFALIYRIFLAYLFYFVSRVLFLVFNLQQLPSTEFLSLFNLFYRGIQFDTTSILYVNSLFILLSIFPTFYNTECRYQNFLKYIYFITNSIAISTNFIDMVYYPFSKSRLTTASLAVVENESNWLGLFFTFSLMYWYMFVLFAFILFLWHYLYNRYKIGLYKPKSKPVYFSTSVLGIALFGILSIAGIRGGNLSTSTRPINILDASRHVNTSFEADVILNSPFSIIRTIGKNKGFRIYNFVDSLSIDKYVRPIKLYKRDVDIKPNIVFFILESFGSEYVGAIGRERNIPDYRSYTPFLDSLSSHSKVFYHAYANGRQSIHAMSSNLAGIPTFQVAYTSSPYVKQPTQSIVSICNEMGYDTSFFHSAPNGSMGFLGFSNILGFKHYYGKNEYNNDKDYDGIWGIWDEPFFEFTNKTLSQKKEPFLGVIFTVSSHHPFKVPSKYEGKFDKGTLPIHQCIGYSDNALREFFNRAKSESWYNNTIFVFVADHTNMSFYKQYQKPISSNSIPIIFFSPNKNLVGEGRDGSLSGQIDIYPSLVDLIGYNKPFRSWGRSLFSDNQDPVSYVTSPSYYQMIKGNYIYVINQDGSVNGIYDRQDEGLEKNLMGVENNDEIKYAIEHLKSFMQDYMDRIINKKLSEHGK